MIKKFASTILLAMASFGAQAEIDPVQQLRQAFEAQQAQNGFAGFGGTCLSGMLFTKSGPQLVANTRTCFVGFFPRSFINDYVAANRLVYMYRSAPMDFVFVPRGTVGDAPKGNLFYAIHYNEAGNVSELTITNDTLP